MFSNSPLSSPWKSRVWGIIIGTIVMLGVPIMIVSAKMVQAVLPLTLLAALAGAVARRRLAAPTQPAIGTTVGLFVFLSYAGLSALWAPEPLTSLSTTLIAAIVSLGSIVLFGLMRSETRANALHICEGLWIGLLAGAAYTIAEIVTDQAIKIWAYNMLGLGPEVLRPARFFTWANGRVVSIHSDDLARNVVPIPLLAWPALLSARSLPAHLWRHCVTTALFVLCACAILGASSETAKLAFVIGTLAFLIAYFSTRLALRIMSVTWILACLAIVPAAHLARQLHLHNASWIQLSGQLRITLWNEVSLLVLKAPFFGVGAGMTRVVSPYMQDAPAAAPSTWLGSRIAHPHNVYLQVWFELGFVGAVLLAALGAVVLRQIGRLENVQRPYAFAMFATWAAQIGFSYSIWQIWFMCLFGFAAAMFAIGQTTSSTRVER